MATYPGGILTFTTKHDLVDVIHDSHVNALQDEITAIETTLGINPQISVSAGTFPDVGTRLENLQTGKAATGHVHPSLPPYGAMMMFAGSAAPAGWLFCDGTSYLRSSFTNLFNALGGVSSPWGLPDASHFNVPDLRGRVPAGVGTGAGGGITGIGVPTGGVALTPRALGNWAGTETVTQTTAQVGAHNHGVTDNAHTHGLTDNLHNHSTGNDSPTHVHGAPAGADEFAVHVTTSSLGLATPGDGHATYSSFTGGATGPHQHGVSGPSANGYAVQGPSGNGYAVNITAAASAMNTASPITCLNFIIFSG